MIDKQKIIDIYNNLDIPNWTEGKNVTKGWVNIQCPFCADPSNHCGVNPDTELFHCWKCGQKRHFVDLLMELTGLSFGACKSIISDSTTTFKKSSLETIRDTFEGEIFEPSSTVSIDVKLPQTFELITKTTSFPLLDIYLRRRNISRDTLIGHECGICRAGDYMNRMIIPVICRGKLVSFQAADLTGFANLPGK